MLSIVERHLHRTGLSASRFGRDVANDPSLVRSLREGRQPGLAMEQRVRAYIAAAAAAADPGHLARDPGLRLVHALAQRAGRPVALVDALCREWRSPTFIGHRHTIRFETDPATAARMCAGWEDHAFALMGHIVVDVAIAGYAAGIVTIDALTVVVA